MQPLLKEFLSENVSQESFLELVAANITLSGVAMTLAQSTTPLSGFEHAMSHCLDMIHFFEETPTVLHGEQVALCCGPALRLMEALLKRTWKEEDFSFPYVQTQIPFMEMLLNQMPLRKDIDFSVKNKNSLKEKKMNLQKEFKKAYLEKIKKWEKCKWNEFCLKQEEIKERIKKYTLNFNEYCFFMERYQLPSSCEKTYPSLTLEQYQWSLIVACYQRSRCSIGDFFLVTSLKAESFF
jgi:glycerol dehydrogenase-like iron-containing ADH family enzyme